MKFSIGPILYFWSQEQVEAFYQQVAKSKADCVYLGETICSKRNQIRPELWLEIGHMLAQSGKEVILSTQALIDSQGELKLLRRACENGDFKVEANDLGAVQILRELKLPFVCGHAINCYNAEVLMLLYKQGMRRYVMPVELSADWLRDLLGEFKSLGGGELEVEVFGYGHLPLAYSARCFTARNEGLTKEECQLCCLKYPEGKAVFNQEQQRLLTLNGIQTQSGLKQNLINDLPIMKDMVDIVRLSPDPVVLDWLDNFHANVIGTHPIKLDPKAYCNGYWHRVPGIKLQN